MHRVTNEIRPVERKQIYTQKQRLKVTPTRPYGYKTPSPREAINSAEREIVNSDTTVVVALLVGRDRKRLSASDSVNIKMNATYPCQCRQTEHHSTHQADSKAMGTPRRLLGIGRARQSRYKYYLRHLPVPQTALFLWGKMRVRSIAIFLYRQLQEVESSRLAWCPCVQNDVCGRCGMIICENYC